MSDMLPDYNSFEYVLETKPKDYIVMCGYETEDNDFINSLNGMPLKINASSPAEAIIRAERYAQNILAIESQSFGSIVYQNLLNEMESQDNGLDKGTREVVAEAMSMPLAEGLRILTHNMIETNAKIMHSIVEQQEKAMGLIESWQERMPVSYMVFEIGKEFAMFGKTTQEVTDMVNGVVDNLEAEFLQEMKKQNKDEEE